MTFNFRLLILFLLIIGFSVQSQTISTDSTQVSKDLKFKYEALIIPAVLIGVGVIGLESHTLKDLNQTTKDELREHIDQKISIDDFSQYSPMVAVYVLNAAGIQGKNNLRDRSIILATSYLIMGGTVNIIKHTGREWRPDGSSNNSFPSGHTATAFMGAEFLFQEYKDVSIWYGLSGYAVAAGTGFFRMYNDRHWFTDVLAGAGIGILSTKIAYWIYPSMKKLLFKEESGVSGVIVPTFQNGSIGIGMAVKF